MSVRAYILNEAERVVTGDRNNAYGDPRQDFQRTAAMWTALLDQKLGDNKIEPHEVAMMMAALKLSRLAWSPGKTDSWLDLAGYAACGAECVDEVQHFVRTMRGMSVSMVYRERVIEPEAFSEEYDEWAKTFSGDVVVSPAHDDTVLTVEEVGRIFDLPAEAFDAAPPAPGRPAHVGDIIVNAQRRRFEVLQIVGVDDAWARECGGRGMTPIGLSSTTEWRHENFGGPGEPVTGFEL